MSARSTARCATKSPTEGRWISREDYANGAASRSWAASEAAAIQRAAGGGRDDQIQGVRFTVIGTMENKIQLSNYFSATMSLSSFPIAPRETSGTRDTRP